MDWIDRFNDVTDYVEENLSGQILPEVAARYAACSTFHFQRMFVYITGVTFTEYVRRRRMTAAALELSEGGARGPRIIDLAAKYGYDSPTAFNRAFQGVHGIAPSRARSRGAALTAYPRITFTLTLKGDTAMNYQIVERDSIRIVGFRNSEPMTMEDSFEKVPAFWHKVYAENGIPRLCALMDGAEPAGILGVSACDGGAFSGFYIAVATGKAVPEGMAVYDIPAGTWAVFESVGPVPDAVQSLQQRIISEWLPNSGYEYAPAPDIEVYPEGDQSAADYKTQIWLPIVKAK